MKREDVIALLEDSAAFNSSLAANSDQSARRARREAESFLTAERYEEGSANARWHAGVAIATLNHLNGVSPE